MNVKELNKEQLDQLKSNLFYNEEERGNLNSQEIDLIESFGNYWDIPDWLVHRAYDGIEFVDDDFCHN